MKIRFIIICMTIPLFAVKIIAQNKQPTGRSLRSASSVAKIDVTPTNFLFKTLALSYEQSIETNWSVAIKASGTYYNASIWNEFEGTISGYSISPECRYYIANYAPQGVYVSVGGKYSDHKFFVEDPTVKSSRLTLFQQKGLQIGGNLGWQFGIGKRGNGMPLLTVDVAFGGGYKFNTIATKFATTGRLLNLKSKGFTPNFDLSIGVPFLN